MCIGTQIIIHCTDNIMNDIKKKNPTRTWERNKRERAFEYIRPPPLHATISLSAYLPTWTHHVPSSSPTETASESHQAPPNPPAPQILPRSKNAQSQPSETLPS
jgi:hypothetical protein